MSKTEIIKFRVTPEEKEILEEKAYGSYRTMSRYLRDCALEKEIVIINGADEIAYELRRIGNNLNQLTHAVNSGYVHEINLTETKLEVARVWQLLNLLRRAAR